MAGTYKGTVIRLQEILQVWNRIAGSLLSDEYILLKPSKTRSTCNKNEKSGMRGINKYSSRLTESSRNIIRVEIQNTTYAMNMSDV